MKALGDRRARVRYEVVGTLRGTLEVSEPARLVNISGAGALVETRRALTPRSLQPMHFELDGAKVRVNMRIRHVTEIGTPAAPCYAVGVEFVSPPEVLAVSIASRTSES